MSTSGLEQFGATIATGSFALVSMLAVYSLSVSANVLETIGRLAEGRQKHFSAVLALSFAVVVGMLAEDFSDVIEDSSISTWLFADETDRSASLLLKEQPNGEWQATNLGREVAASGVMSRPLEGPGDALAKAIHQTPAGHSFPFDANVARRVARQTFYLAKNLAYAHPSYYDELRGIDKRIDFARSLVFVSALLILLILPAHTVGRIMARLHSGRRVSKLAVAWNMFISVIPLGMLLVLTYQTKLTDNSYGGTVWTIAGPASWIGVVFAQALFLGKPATQRDQERDQRRRSLYYGAGLFVVLLLILGASRAVLRHEEQEHAKRAFGYGIAQFDVNLRHP